MMKKSVRDRCPQCADVAARRPHLRVGIGTRPTVRDSFVLEKRTELRKLATVVSLERANLIPSFFFHDCPEGLKHR